MKRRFQVTLLAVAIASLSASAFALAPVIGEFKSPIIADNTPVTGSNHFVYPDVFDLNTKATDPDNTVAPAGIIWSMTGDGTYRIDNRVPITVGTDNPNAPGAKEIGKTGQEDPDKVDTNVRTITFRNNALSPVGGPDVNPGGSGVLPAQTKAVTLFASDGSTYTMKSFLVYTDKGGVDRLSGAPISAFTPVVAPATPGTGGTGVNGWTTFSIIGSPTFTSTGGLCINSPLANGAFGGWVSPYGLLPLLANQVYRIRLTVSAPTAIAAGQAPLWDFVIDNFGGATTGESKYSSQYIFWDNNGNANSAGLASPNGRHTFDIWFSPLAITMADWNDPNTGEFRASNDANNDGRLQFRYLDLDNSAVDGQNDAGTQCMTQFQLDRIDNAALTASSTLYTNSTFAANTHVVTPLNLVANGTTVTYPSGALQVAPSTSTSWDVEVISIDVGDNNVNYSQPTTLSDNWPIPWTSNQLLKYTAGVQAPNALGETNGPDAITLQMDPASTEVLEQDLIALTSNKIGGPKAASVSDYTSFFFSHNKSASPTTQLGFLRARVVLLCRSDLHQPGSKTGGFRLTYQKVEVIDTSSLP
jgi:hypothetical protein